MEAAGRGTGHRFKGSIPCTVAPSQSTPPAGGARVPPTPPGDMTLRRHASPPRGSLCTSRTQSVLIMCGVILGFGLITMVRTRSTSTPPAPMLRADTSLALSPGSVPGVAPLTASPPGEGAHVSPPQQQEVPPPQQQPAAVSVPVAVAPPPSSPQQAPEQQPPVATMGGAGAVAVAVPSPSATPAASAAPSGRRLLVCMTTCNMWALTEQALANLQSLVDPIDIYVVDDASEDHTADKVSAMGLPVLGTPKPRGLTAGWNRAYKYFMDHPEYEAAFVVNNDIIFPNNTFNRLADALKDIQGPAVVGPMTTKAGLGISYKHAGAQNSQAVFNVPDKLVAGLPGTTQQLQDLVASQSKAPHFTRTGWILGYCMGFDREVAKMAYSPTALYDPRHLVIGQEDELFERRHVPAYAVTNSFVFHHKGGTLKKSDTSRENIMMCHPKHR